VTARTGSSASAGRLRPLPAGPRGVLIDCGTGAAARACYRALQQRRSGGTLEATDLVPGATTVLVEADATVIGAIAIRDELRPEAAEAIAALHRMGVRTVVLTGDNERTAHALAAHAGVTEVHADLRPEDKAALVTDLKQRGLLDSTIVHWGGEIGRLPVSEGEGDACGRDHNGQGFSVWLAGGGIKPGFVYGETDEVGHKAVTDIVTPRETRCVTLRFERAMLVSLLYS
jgi:hypothetical protein